MAAQSDFMIFVKVPERLRNFSKVVYGITDDACGEEINLNVCAFVCRPFQWPGLP